MSLFLYYLSRELINILAALEENQQPMMTIENRSVWPGLQRTRLCRVKRGYYGGSRKTAEPVELD